MIIIILLFILLTIKHFLCDIYLQSYKISSGKRELGYKGLCYLSIHCGMHMIGTLISFGLIFIFYQPKAVSIVIMFGWLDFISHFIIDRIKISFEELLAPVVFKSTKWWILLGVDQSLHFLCYIGYIAIIIKIYEIQNYYWT